MSVVDPNEAALAALGQAQEHAATTKTTVDKLLEVAQDGQPKPAKLKAFALSQLEPRQRDESSQMSMSIALLNPSPVVVFIGVDGPPRRDARVPSVPPGAGLVLPIAAQDVELGAEPADLAGGEAVVFLLRFETVQPFYFWRA